MSGRPINRTLRQTDAFQAFRGGYPFAAAFCAPAKGWEKGSVEASGQVVTVRMTPQNYDDYVEP